MVHGFDTRDHCVYDLDGRPSQISIGALLETMAIAASSHGLAMTSRRRIDVSETTPTFDVTFMRSADVKPDPLLDCVTRRTVQRRAMNGRPLTQEEKARLEASVAPRYRIRWLEGSGTKWRVARLLFLNAKVRLTMPEAYEVHRSIIEWGATFSEDRVPAAALGADAATVRMMKFVMQSWTRVQFFNKFMAGTLLPRIQMDLLPAIACSAHYLLLDTEPPQSTDDFVAAGRAVQRLWLTFTQLGLSQQPEMTPVIFGSYVRRGIPFTRDVRVAQMAARVSERFLPVTGVQGDNVVWMGRIGRGPVPTSRSTRKPLSNLMIERPISS